MRLYPHQIEALQALADGMFDGIFGHAATVTEDDGLVENTVKCRECGTYFVPSNIDRVPEKGAAPTCGRCPS